jgi:hypothetical protein
MRVIEPNIHGPVYIKQLTVIRNIVVICKQ